MDYSKLSDFEINVAVFEAIHGGSPDYKEGDGGAMVPISYEGDIVGGDAVEVEVERGVFNPCNNPEDAWPIIIKQRIGLSPAVNGDKWAAYYHEWLVAFADGNPLRAAMIVLLMMQESANVQDNPA
ncbi:phage protein NinX family protein [Citrobacter portucalensis]|uniref:Phage protein NinX family protein n=1 Tax=Citrobacter portucalensis TaxID=1639133 RepID=A0ABD5H3S4_9ENTR|nr:phage protein NinX family protein [Citrobacter portucalensis]MDW2635934.1 phage protein NinX family protein [Citrobacter portucalensis]